MKVDDLRKLVAAMTPSPWRPGRGENAPALDELWRCYVYAPSADHLAWDAARQRVCGPDSPVRVVLRLNHHDAHVAHDAAGIAALRNHAEPLLKLAEAVRRYIDAECTGESSETDDHTIALLRGECAGDTHHGSCRVEIARQALHAALGELEAEVP